MADKYTRPAASDISRYDHGPNASRFRRSAMEREPLKADIFDLELNYLIKAINEVNDRGTKNVLNPPLTAAGKLLSIGAHAQEIVYTKLNDNLVQPQGLDAHKVLKPKSITTNELADNVVNEGQISDGCITTPKIAKKAVTHDKIREKSINSSHIINKAITKDHMGFSSVTKSAIAKNAVDGTKILKKAIDAVHLAKDSVTTDAIKDKSITLAKLATGAVEIPDRSITAEKIKKETITANEIAEATITSREIKDRSILNRSLANNCVDTSQIKDRAITHNKISANAVSGHNIADRSITSAHFSRRLYIPKQCNHMYVVAQKLSMKGLLSSQWFTVVVGCNANTAWWDRSKWGKEDYWVVPKLNPVELRLTY